MKEDYSQLKPEAEAGVFKQWQEVDVVVYDFTDIGIKVAINNEYSGLAYKNEVFIKLRLGQKLKAYIKYIREDGKIDVSFQPQEGEYVSQAADKIFQVLKESNGKLLCGDKSSSEDIKKKFEISKKVFKKAIGRLYKQHKIKIAAGYIEIVNKNRVGQ
ncbi:MAG: type I-B CRISPR-associated protein Cas8b1/Cst1 [Omnitrophica bacterium]|nr:type I-B CRISPR-associated protein Cas8b1/Cst1 [Candidatus Omnitrophota bacterium]